MQIYRYPDEKRIKTGCVLALGFFDGVHIAHRDLIYAAKDEAARLGAEFGVFTFDGDIKSAAKKIYANGEREEILDSLGADFTVIYDFAAIKDMTAEEFVKKILVKEMGCTVAVAGYNFRFGKGALGDAEALVRLMSECGGEAVIREEITDEGLPVSSTRIRDLLARGEMREAARLLGLPYYIKGRVEKGRGDGRTLGFPTVNMALSKDSVPLRRGVYRSVTSIDGVLHASLTNVGTCPTFSERGAHAETYILDFSGDLYGKDVRVYLIDFMREEIAFSSPDELKMQINIDKNRVITENGDEKWQELGLK